MDLPTQEILTGQFGKAELEDTNLQNARGQVIVVDGVLLPGVSVWRLPHFSIKYNLLYQVVKHNGETYPDSMLRLCCSLPTPTCLGHTWGWRKPGSGSGTGSTGPESSAPWRTTAVVAWSARSQLRGCIIETLWFLCPL